MKTDKYKNKRKSLLLESSHGKEIGPCFMKVYSIFKPNVPLAKVAEDREAW
jgi:hypothetical protein